MDAAKTICQHIANRQASDLDEDRLLLGGVIRELLLIGEAANAISPKAQNEISEIPWRKVIGMRNQLIHGYFDISSRIIWSTVQEDIPKLIEALEQVFQQADLPF